VTPRRDATRYTPAQDASLTNTHVAHSDGSRHRDLLDLSPRALDLFRSGFSRRTVSLHISSRWIRAQNEIPCAVKKMLEDLPRSAFIFALCHEFIKKKFNANYYNYKESFSLICITFFLLIHSPRLLLLAL